MGRDEQLWARRQFAGQNQFLQIAAGEGPRIGRDAGCVHVELVNQLRAHLVQAVAVQERSRPVPVVFERDVVGHIH